eukprot:14740016-Alexandrium_andersonii.AAC.1
MLSVAAQWSCSTATRLTSWRAALSLLSQRSSRAKWSQNQSAQPASPVDAKACSGWPARPSAAAAPAAG